MTLRHMMTVPGYRILARNLLAGGYSRLQVADAMTQRLALDRFDGVELDEVERQKLEELREFLRELAISPRGIAENTKG